ncbi:MAG: hypothetical protein AAGC70_08955 [Pseudomonadota bacterium]
MRSIITLFVVALSVLAVPPARSQGTTHTSAEFLRALDLYANDVSTGLDWERPASPWFPYIESFDWEVVPVKDIALYLALQRTGQCQEVRYYTKRLFLERFPNLAAAFMSDAVVQIFMRELVVIKSRGLQRCRYLKSIASQQKILDNKERDFDPYWLAPSEQKYPPNPFKDRHYFGNAELRRNANLRLLLSLAACDEYPPAVGDIVKFAASGRMLQLGPELEYYVLKLARELRVESRLIGKRLLAVAPQLDIYRRAEIDAAVRYSGYRESGIGLWRCPGPRAGHS